MRVCVPADRNIIWTVRGTRKANAQLLRRLPPVCRSTCSNQVCMGTIRRLRRGRGDPCHSKNIGNACPAMNSVCANVNAEPAEPLAQRPERGHQKSADLFEHLSSTIARTTTRFHSIQRTLLISDKQSHSVTGSGVCLVEVTHHCGIVEHSGCRLSRIHTWVWYSFCIAFPYLRDFCVPGFPPRAQRHDKIEDVCRPRV